MQPREQWVFGSGLDELVLSKKDLSGDGSFETAYQPLYDSQGSLVALSSVQGQLVGAARYSPFGNEWGWRADLAPPVIEHLHIEGVLIFLEALEELAGETLAQAESSSGIRLEISLSGGAGEAFGLEEASRRLPP